MNVSSLIAIIFVGKGSGWGIDISSISLNITKARAYGFE
jgi:hypothetical protein